MTNKFTLHLVRLAVIFAILGGVLPPHSAIAETGSRSNPPSATYPGNSIFQLSGDWLTSEGKKVKLDDLSGKVTALSMVYTNCQYACPMIIEEFNKLKTKLNSGKHSKKLSQVRFVLLSMDPERDTPSVIKAYMKKRNLDPELWSFYTAPNNKIVQELAVVLGLSIKKIGQDYSHSNTITILDQKGVVSFVKQSLGKQVDETVDSIEKLLN